MRRFLLLTPLLLLALFTVPAFAVGKCERIIATGSPDAPPYLWRNPQDPTHLIGANADVFKQVAQEMGLKVEFLFAGNRRQAMDEVRSGRMDMLVDAPLLASELESLDYIHPPIIQILSADGSPADNSGLYLALSFNSACNEPWLRGQLAKKMTEFAASGRSAEAVERHRALWQTQSLTPAGAPDQ